MTSTTGFPQPKRPDNSYSPRLPTETPYPAPQYLPPPATSSPAVTAYPVPSHLLVPPPVGFPVQLININRDGYSDDDSISTEEERESIEELKRGILELYEKLPASIRSRINLDKFHIPNDIVTGLKVDDARSREVRGIVDQLSPKLERFKVRTVRGGGGGVVTVDDDDEAGDKTRHGTQFF